LCCKQSSKFIASRGEFREELFKLFNHRFLDLLRAAERSVNHHMTLQQRFAALAKDRFLGVPVEDFEAAGREQLDYLRKAGLSPGSKLVDLGCGVLRAGYWIIRFLDPGCYCGIEPHQGRLQTGIQGILDPETVELKRPRFHTNPNFDTSVFGEQFDFFLAYSVWTHASKSQIQIMLDAFLRDSTDHGIFLATYLPAGFWRGRDYLGETWYGTSHESDLPGCIHHSFTWIKVECERRGLTPLNLGRDGTHGQVWLQIKRSGLGAGRPCEK
jgi:hypothetical protein